MPDFHDELVATRHELELVSRSRAKCLTHGLGHGDLSLAGQPCTLTLNRLRFSNHAGNISQGTSNVSMVPLALVDDGARRRAGAG